MLKVFLMPCKQLCDSAYIKRACAFLSGEREAHALSMKKESDRALSVGAGLLLAYGLLNLGNDLMDVVLCKVDVEEVLARLERFDEKARENLKARLSIKEKEQGKPYFTWENAPCFSISHSGEYVAVAFCDKEVGVDLQMERALKSEKIYDRVLCENGKEKKEDFFFLWTAKEAYVKATGEGLVKDFTKLYADRENMCVEEQPLYELLAPPGYHLVACVLTNVKCM